MTWFAFIALAILILVVWDQLSKRVANGGSSNPRLVTRGQEWKLDATALNVIEGDFEIGYAAYWTFGRTFEVILRDVECEGLEAASAEQLSLKVFPLSEGLVREDFGRIFVSSSYSSFVMHIPFEVARHLLEDLRSMPEGRRRISVRGASLQSKKSGEIQHVITHFRFS